MDRTEAYEQVKVVLDKLWNEGDVTGAELAQARELFAVLKPPAEQPKVPATCMTCGEKRFLWDLHSCGSSQSAQGAEVERHIQGLAYAKEGYEAHRHEGHDVALQEAICHYNAATQPCLLSPPQPDREAVERVARALAAEDYRQKQRGDYNDANTFASRHWGEYQPEARVAIAALQSAPSEGQP